MFVNYEGVSFVCCSIAGVGVQIHARKIQEGTAKKERGPGRASKEILKKTAVTRTTQYRPAQVCNGDER
jgi:hypothetical protein